MKQPSIVVLHKLPNRIRVKLSLPIRNIEDMKSMVMKHDGIISIEYSDITRSILVYFNPLRINFEEVLIRITIGFSKEYGLTPVKILSKQTGRDMPNLAYYSVVSIASAYVSLFLKSNKSIQELLNWLAVGTTIGAIMEHAWLEIRKKGAFDPEVVSVMYLINSMIKGNFISASALTWITTFGRHILDFSYDEIKLQVYEQIDNDSDEVYYNINIMQDQNISNAVDFLKVFMCKCIERRGTIYRKNSILEGRELSNNPRIMIRRSGQACSQCVN